MSEPPRSNLVAKRRHRSPGRRHRIDVRPASFAGTSRIRFGGYVAYATLSALEALPGGGVRLCRKPSTLAEPGDDVVEDRRPLRLVVELVTQTRVGPPLDAGRALEDLGRRGGTRPSSSPWRTSVGPPIDRAPARTRACSRERLGPEARGAGLAVQRVDGRPARPTSGSRDSVSGRDAVRRTTASARSGRATAPGASSKPASVESRPGAVSTDEVRVAADPSAGSPPRSARPSSGRRGTTGRPSAAAEPPPAAPRGRRGSGSSGRCRRVGRPTAAVAAVVVGVRVDGRRRAKCSPTCS